MHTNPAPSAVTDIRTEFKIHVYICTHTHAHAHTYTYTPQSAHTSSPTHQNPHPHTHAHPTHTRTRTPRTHAHTHRPRSPRAQVILHPLLAPSPAVNSSVSPPPAVCGLCSRCLWYRGLVSLGERGLVRGLSPARRLRPLL